MTLAKTLILFAIALLGSCIGIESYMESGTGYMDISWYPKSSRLINLQTEDGTILRGVWTQSDNPDASIILFFQGVGGHLGGIKEGGPGSVIHRFARSAKAFGFSSLVVDYRGVGISDGTPSIEHMASDVQAIWNRALKYADGDESRIILRGVSLGTLAAARLIRDGANPRCALFHCPIRSETAINNFLDDKNPIFRALASLFIKSYDYVNIIDLLNTTHVPFYLSLAGMDPFLNDQDIRLFQGVGANRIGSKLSHCEQAMVVTANLQYDELMFFQEENIYHSDWITAAKEVLLLNDSNDKSSDIEGLFNTIDSRFINHMCGFIPTAKHAYQIEWLCWINNLDFIKKLSTKDKIQFTIESINTKQLPDFSPKYLCAHCIFRTLHRLSCTLQFGPLCGDHQLSTFKQTLSDQNLPCLILILSLSKYYLNHDYSIDQVVDTAVHMQLWSAGFITRKTGSGVEYLENNEWKTLLIPESLVSSIRQILDDLRSRFHAFN